MSPVQASMNFFFLVFFSFFFLCCPVFPLHLSVIFQPSQFSPDWISPALSLPTPYPIASNFRICLCTICTSTLWTAAYWAFSHLKSWIFTPLLSHRFLPSLLSSQLDFWHNSVQAHSHMIASSFCTCSGERCQPQWHLVDLPHCGPHPPPAHPPALLLPLLPT